MGITHTDTAAAGDAETLFTSRFRVSFSASGETDNGLSFGASVRADNAGAGAGNTAMSGGSVFISGAFGRLTMGDITAANEAATGNVAGVGFTGLGDTNDTGYLGTNDTGLAYSYSVDGLTIGLSTSQRAASAATGTAAETDALGVSYKFGDYTFGLGYAEQGINKQTSVSVRGSVQGLGFAVVYLDNNRVTGAGAATVDTDVAASVSYTMDALTLTAFSRTIDYFAAGTENRVYTGIGASYNLGGGASLRAGFVDGGGATKNDNAYDLGVTFSF